MSTARGGNIGFPGQPSPEEQGQRDYAVQLSPGLSVWPQATLDRYRHLLEALAPGVVLVSAEDALAEMDEDDDQ